MPSVKSTSVPLRMLQLRPPGRWRASRIVQDQPALPSSYAATRPAMPPPRITTRVPRPSTRRSGRFGCGFGNRQQAEGLHEDEGGAASAGLAGTHQELTSGKAHLDRLSWKSRGFAGMGRSDLQFIQQRGITGGTGEQGAREQGREGACCGLHCTKSNRRSFDSFAFPRGTGISSRSG